MTNKEGILVVDDDVALCNLMRMALEQSGYLVWTAHSGPEALAVFAKHGSDLRLLVTDVRMPEMSGFTLGEALVRRKRDLPVLYVSGSWGAQPPPRSTAAALAKPFTVDDLLDQVAKLAPVTAEAG